MRGVMLVVLLTVGVAVLFATTRSSTDGDPGAEGTEAEVQAVPGQEGGPGEAQAQDVLSAVEALFDAMRAKDTLALAELFHSEARLQSAAVGADGAVAVEQGNIESFVRSIGRAEAELDEQIGEGVVQVDGPLATAWTPYAFFMDGEFSHCGVNAFQLVRTMEGWKILQIIDTRRQNDCPSGAPV